MSDPREHDDLGLPPELAALDKELLSVRYEERPSFGPELEAELAKAWKEMPLQSAPPVRRRWAAAAVVALLAVGLSVPQARASLVRLVQTLQGDTAEASSPVPEQPGEVPVIEVETPDVELEEEAPARPVIPSEPPANPEAVDRYLGPEATFPEIVDRPGVERLVRDYYPMDLQRAGVGGTVRVLLWVDSAGSVDFVNLGQGSGVPGLDRAALQVAPSLRFIPAQRRGEPVGTWVEFDITFQPNPDEYDPFTLPAVDPVQRPEMPETLDLSLVPEWRGELVLVSPVQREAGELLEAAVGDDDLLDELGSVETILAAEPPPGVGPTTWRADVTNVLEAAMVRDPDNPAPLLALARIRRKQGLKTEARALFERGLQRALRGGSGVSPSLLAEFMYERGTLVRESWLGHRATGRLASAQVPESVCPQARVSAEGAGAYASVDHLMAWNYLCPARLGEAMDAGFEATDQAAGPDLDVMMTSFRTAIEADPAHVGANVELLLALVDEGRWESVLDGARRFIWASRGHPYGLLISGLALQRLSRTEEAEGQIQMALRGLPAAEAAEIQDIRLLLNEGMQEYVSLSAEEKDGWAADFWAPLDPILTTDVNERRVEHLVRASYAHLRFGSAASEAGEVWVRYGRPTDVRVLREASGLRTEFWDYGTGPDITFRRMASSEDMNLTPEARTYLDELRRVFPHRYGTSSRTVFTLPGQLSRFMAPVPGRVDLEIHTEVPTLIATGSRDTLDVGVFLLDSEGERLLTTRRRIPARQAPISFRAPADPEVSGVVVEVFNRRTGQAAALRDAARLPPRSVGSVAISDLLLVEAATPDTDEVDRRAPWVRPETLVGPVEDAAFGALFELYGVRDLSSWYRLRAEIVNRDTGETVAVPIRPAGEEGFRATWERRIPEGIQDPHEYVTVALTDVSGGRYTIRIVVDVPGAQGPLVSERNLDRR